MATGTTPMSGSRRDACSECRGGVFRSRGSTLRDSVRLGYLAEWAGRHDIAEQIGVTLPEQLPVTYFGVASPQWPVGETVAALRLGALAALITEGSWPATRQPSKV